MVKVEITRRYIDVELNQRFEAGVIREVSQERAEALVNAGVATILEIIPEEEKKPAKKTTRKATTKKTEKKTRKGYTRKK